MESIVRIGMDVHQESIRLAVITDSGNGAGGGKIVLEDTVSITSESVRRTFKKLKKKFWNDRVLLRSQYVRICYATTLE